MPSQASDEAPDVLEREQAQSLTSSRFLLSADANQSKQISRRQCAFFCGYSLHAERCIDAEDGEGLERLCRYGARAPIANGRLSLNDQGDAIIDMKQPLQDGRTQLVFPPGELLQKLAILIPPPRKNLTRYHGVFGPAHRHRSKVVPLAKPDETRKCHAGSGGHVATKSAVATAAPPRFSWAELLRRVFAIDILKCDHCGGPMKIIAVIPESPVADQILDHLGLEMPGAKATGPPILSAALH